MIYINGRFLEQKLTGVQRFAKEISIHLSELRETTILVSDLKKIEELSVLDQLNILEVKGGHGHYWEQITLPRFLSRLSNPILINLASTAPVFYKNKISTHHDITYIRYPKSFSPSFRLLYKILMPNILKTSKKIITVSNFSKKEISEHYKINEENFTVIYNAVSDVFYRDNVTPKDKRPYLLAVSSPNYHKNFEALISAFLDVSLDVDLQIIGSVSSSFNKINYNIQNDSRIKFLGRVDDLELSDLYGNAMAFVFPSLYEGFGIPPLEAQAKGCPVISSNSASMPEVLGCSVSYFDPKDLISIRNAIENICINSELRKELIELGHENVSKYSWKSSAEKLNAMISEL